MFGFEGQIFHVGLLTHDIDAAMAEISESQSVTWAQVRDWPMRVWLPERGEIEMDIKLTYSRQGPFRLELIQGSPGTPVDPAQGTGTHHVGYWVDDPAAETERLLAQGGELVMSAASPDEGYGRFTYVRWPNGMLVEPVGIANRPRFEEWWAGGELRRPTAS